MTGQEGSGRTLGQVAPRLARPVVERRDSHAAMRLAGPATAPPQLAGNRAPKPGESSRAPHLVGLVVERGTWERSGAERGVRELILFFIRRAAHAAVSGARRPAFRTS